jgi:ribosomal protein S18 acetylase RimI-like enzyme
MNRIIRAETAEELEQALNLFEKYASSLEFSLDFQDFEEELANFPGVYEAPRGCILLAINEGQYAGCVALRELDTGICEMKRLYVLPNFQRLGLGRVLAEAILDEARRLGYDRMRLDTVPSMKAATTLYESLGFKEIPPYCHNPIKDALYMELVL